MKEKNAKGNKNIQHMKENGLIMMSIPTPKEPRTQGPKKAEMNSVNQNRTGLGLTASTAP